MIIERPLGCARVMGSQSCFELSGSQLGGRLNRSNLVRYALTANIHQFDDQGSPYDMCNTLSGCDFEVEV